MSHSSVPEFPVQPLDFGLPGKSQHDKAIGRVDDEERRLVEFGEDVAVAPLLEPNRPRSVEPKW